MSNFLSKLPNLVSTILIIAGIGLCLVPVFRPQLFKRQDILLVLLFFVSAALLLWKGKYLDERPQWSLILLSIPAIFYTIETLLLRHKKQLNAKSEKPLVTSNR
ncbi:MAG: hypothetical protein KME17_05605 [Cyanosarcina radialis HA8281-LM2]|jgi:hypothetical membrane protein|nr:hypothetical protein [Cyanosarcina radialis HA8281-LM2]